MVLAEPAPKGGMSRLEEDLHPPRRMGTWKARSRVLNCHGLEAVAIS